MLQRKYRSKVVSIENPFKGIYTIEFESLKRSYKFLPGQFLHISLDEDYDGSGQWPESRCFSMQSNPNDKTIKITYAVKGNFTKEMERTLTIDSEVWLKLPYGDLFQQPHSKENTVFIAGGTGITPLLSLFTHESFAEYLNPKIYLGFRTQEYNIYQDELNRMNQILNNPCNPCIFYENTDGIINIENIYIKNGNSCHYFISGPPAMIKAFKLFLISKGVHESNVLTDDWE